MTLAERTLTILVLGVTLFLILAGDPLAMYDVSSHLATTVLVDRIFAGDPFFSAHYRIEWIPVPYWLTTALHWPLTKLLGPWLAMRILVAAYAVALPLGWWYLARRTGASSTLVPLVALAVFSGFYWSGVTNFLFGQALIAPAYRMFLDLDGVRTRRFVLLGLVLLAAYSAHVFVLASILGSCGLAWLFSLAAARRFPVLADFRPRGAHVAFLAAGAALFALAVWFIFAHPGEGANTGRLLFDHSPHRIGNAFENPLSSPSLDSPWPAAGLLLVLLLAWALPRARTLRRDPAAALSDALHVPTALIAGAFVLLLYLGPVALEEPGGRIEESIAPRFALTAFLLGLASLRLPALPAARGALLAATALFGVLKLGDAAALHAQQRARWAEYREGILERIPTETRLLPILVEKGRDAPRSTYFFQFFGNYVVPLRHGYSPSVYAAPGQQFLRHVPPGGGPGGEHRDIHDRTITEAEWDFYDYVVLQTNRERPEIPGLAERTEEMGGIPGFRLYRVRKGDGAGS